MISFMMSRVTGFPLNTTFSPTLARLGLGPGPGAQFSLPPAAGAGPSVSASARPSASTSASGAVLAAARLRSGALWLPIGVHAAFVAAFRVGRLFFIFAPMPWLVGAGWPPLVGGVAGMLAITVTGGFVLRQTRYRAFQLDNAPGSGALLLPR